VPLPNPLPDNPNRWDGWRNYNSENFYERLGLSFDSNASNDQIEDNCRQLLVWWQKKLPLKNQPSNPLSQLLRSGLDEAPIYLVEARTILLDPETRRKHDHKLRGEAMDEAIEEFQKLITFALSSRTLTPEEEARLANAGVGLGLTAQESIEAIQSAVVATGTVRTTPAAAAPPPAPAAPQETAGSTASAAAARLTGADAGDPFAEFRRLLRMSRLCVDGDDMTDDQRDAMCNLGESLGLTGGQAEDLIDEYLEEAASAPMAPASKPVAKPAAPPARPAAAPQRAATVAPPARPAAAAPVAQAAPAPPPVVFTPLIRAQEREKYPNFTNSISMEMFLITSATFNMGSAERDAQPNEQPVTPVTVSCFYMARRLITNAQYEMFDPAHKSKRATWADDQHPAIYVSALDAERYCEWLSRHEGRRYRLPTEAEWEYSARGLDSRTFPWGNIFDAGHYANFADIQCTVPWRDPRFDDGWPQTSPVGFYSKGASPFGLDDMAGNVFEWCLDGFDAYKGRPVSNPRGAGAASKRVYRGGSWKSRLSTVRAPARAFNTPDYNSNDVGFRIVCECD
jgi:formylglycine-generating enzyme required for sulfatase activity